MDQTAIDATGLTLERNQDILLKEILEEVASWFGASYLKKVAVV